MDAESDWLKTDHTEAKEVAADHTQEAEVGPDRAAGVPGAEVAAGAEVLGPTPGPGVEVEGQRARVKAGVEAGASHDPSPGVSPHQDPGPEHQNRIRAMVLQVMQTNLNQKKRTNLRITCMKRHWT